MAKKQPEDYEKFWEQFGRVLKEGPGEDIANKDRIAKLLRFASTKDDTNAQTVSLDAYIERMKEGQERIYFITAETFAAAKNSPHLEVFRKKDIEVLLLSDRVDEWLTGSLTEYEGKQLQSVTKGELDLGDLEDKEEKAEQEKVAEDYADLVKKVQENLDGKIAEVRITHRLTESPACLVSGENDMSANLERILKSAGQDIGGSKPIFEINPDHPLVARLKGEEDDARFDDLTSLLFEQALLSEGGQLEDPASFVKRMNQMLLTMAG